MKILLWAPYGAGTHFWGPGTSAFRMYKTLTKDCEVTLVHASENQGEFPEVYYRQVKLPTLEKTGWLGYLRYLIASYNWIRKNGHEYDVFHGLSAYEYTFRPALYFCALKKPVFIKITGHYGGFGRAGLMSNILGLAKSRINNANKITGYISTSSDITLNLRKIGVLENKIHQIPNGVNTKIFFPLDSETRRKERKKRNIKDIFTLIYVGGLTENKRVYECVQAVNILLQKGFNLQLLIVGPDRSDGIVLNKITRYIVQNKISDKVFLKGRTDNPEQFFQIANAFLLPSKREGMPNALLEAMACGLPSIVTEVSGSRDLIKDGVQGIFTTGSPEDIAAKISRLFDEEFYVYLSNNARKTTVEKYDTSVVLNEHLRIFEAIK